MPFQHANLLGQLQADTASADDTNDGGRARVRLDEVQHLPGDDRQHLRHQTEADFVQRIAAGCADALNLLFIRAFNRFGK